MLFSTCFDNNEWTLNCLLHASFSYLLEDFTLKVELLVNAVVTLNYLGENFLNYVFFLATGCC